MEALIPSPLRVYHTKLVYVTDTVREAILEGRLVPGTRLVIDDIAKRLQVSSIPVREALQALQGERLVEIRPHIGAVVTDIEPDAIREIFALFEGLEVATFRRAADIATAEDIAELRRQVEQMDDLGDDRTWAERNSAFHLHVAEVARMPRAREVLVRIGGEWERLRRLAFRDHARPDAGPAQAEHRAMVEALAHRDLTALESLAREHNRSALRHYLPGG